MNLHLEPLRHAGDVKGLLRDDGWLLQQEPDGWLLASHPRVRDEAGARSRLQDLGLLTCSSLRIEFRHLLHPPPAPPR
jgi:hypothetical protein